MATIPQNSTLLGATNIANISVPCYPSITALAAANIIALAVSG